MTLDRVIEGVRTAKIGLDRVSCLSELAGGCKAVGTQVTMRPESIDLVRHPPPCHEARSGVVIVCFKASERASGGVSRPRRGRLEDLCGGWCS